MFIILTIIVFILVIQNSGVDVASRKASNSDAPIVSNRYPNRSFQARAGWLYMNMQGRYLYLNSNSKFNVTALSSSTMFSTILKQEKGKICSLD